MAPEGKVQRLQLPAGVPTLEQLAAMSKALMGRDATPEELEKAQATLQRVADKRRPSPAASSGEQTDGSGQPPDGH